MLQLIYFSMRLRLYFSFALRYPPMPRGSSTDDVTAACTHLIAAKDGTDKSRLLTRLAPRAHKVNVNWLHHCAAHFLARVWCAVCGSGGRLRRGFKSASPIISRPTTKEIIFSFKH
jgi:hypothetical protein